MVAKELPCYRRLRSPSVANGGVSTCGESVSTVNKDMGKIAQEQHGMRIWGVETPGSCAARRATVSIEAYTRQRVPDPPHEATERLIARGPEIMINPVDEKAGKAEAQESAVGSAAEAGLSTWGVGDLRGIVLISVLRVVLSLLCRGVLRTKWLRFGWT